ncbi:hypothetical protein HMPREF1050_1064 [Haemophilus parahaemolyticus HK385]|uniref:Uncharacterized protein n=1 Tax=Haemophilus parahaemolyticus HK385 TaxID=1095744 RepID=A0ABP2P351_HAEPH|nr:hypothetical protein HMPREF1050_1064 [Haemophilus parahaemolyticus HK385]DAY09018.1 MAG TPA: hypothetical protein [Caudoviricetes sp.]
MPHFFRLFILEISANFQKLSLISEYPKIANFSGVKAVHIY